MTHAVTGMDGEMGEGARFEGLIKIGSLIAYSTSPLLCKKVGSPFSLATLRFNT